MILALLWKSIPNSILGHIKHKFSLELYDKILYTDSKMNKADWMTGFASIIGIFGIGMGYWWADSTIAMLIAINIVYDGFTNLRQSILDLIDEIPKQLGSNKTDPILTKLKTFVSQQNWIKETHVRFRDEGHVFFGEIFIKPKSERDLLENIKQLHKDIRQLHWRIHDVVIVIIPQ
jgi:divalent metal cation (Fe/Co/Zn/Cd) transporter